MHRLGVVVELFRMIAAHRTWILLPPLLAIVLAGALIVLGEATPLGPFIYPLF